MPHPTSPKLALVLDVGNTRTKAALFSGERVLRSAQWVKLDGVILDAFVGTDRPEAVGLGSVAGADPQLRAELAQVARLTELNGQSPSPLRMRYATPDTLGVDRLANAVAARKMFPARPSLAIDLGSCITYDLVDPGGAYLGGAISPGLRMRSRAMHAYSASLPEVEPAGQMNETGDDTATSLASGVHHGIRHELEGFIRSWSYQYPGLAVVLTGGDALRFARALKTGIFADPLLTLKGLHALLEFQSAAAGAARRP